jgi:enoyl-CoA hydratase
MESRFETVEITMEGAVAVLRLNRPQSANALDRRLWEELKAALAWLDTQPPVRAVVLHGEGRHFTAGIDLSVVDWLRGVAGDPACPARASEAVLAFIEFAQSVFNAVETLKVPVIAAIHGACIGAGVDLIGACDIRLAAKDARFCVKEVDLAIVPDVGTIQRLRHVIGYSAVAELCYTAETFDAERALALGLVSRVLDSKEALLRSALEMAQTIAAKPPVAVRGIKRNLLWARDRSVQDGLAYTAAWNAAMMIGADTAEAIAAQAEKRAPVYRD